MFGKHKTRQNKLSSNAKRAYLLKWTASNNKNCRKNNSTTVSHMKHATYTTVMCTTNTHNTSLWVPLASVAEGRCQGGRTALIIQGGASIIDGWVDRNRPHARGITIAIAVIIATTISWCPYVDAAFTTSALKQEQWELRGRNENWELGNFTSRCWCVLQCHQHNLMPNGQRINQNNAARKNKP